jgi:DNA-binding SARP family transcriptional activator
MIRGVRSHIQFAILGPLRARVLDAAGSRPVALGSFKQRALLALLLCRPNTFVSVDQLIDALWDDAPPPTAHKNVQVYVSHLRRVLATEDSPEPIEHRTRSYALRVEPADLDACRFEQLVREGRQARREGHVAAAAAALREALGAWSGEALTDLASLAALRAAAARLADQRLTASEDWIDAELALGRHLDVIDDIERLVTASPLRERLRSQQMTALYRSGRQSDALAEFDNVRRLLASELGLQPSPALQRLYQAMLSGHQSLDPPAEPLRPEVVAHSTLPPDVPDFTGHEQLLAELVGLVSRAPRPAEPHRGVLVLAGPPGVGKTSLAVRLAHQVRPAFPDGQLVVALRGPAGTPIAPAEVAGVVLDLLGVEPEEMPTGDSRRLALFQTKLADRRMLLVYDDAHTEAQVRPLLPASGSSVALVTSHRHLGGLAGAAHRRLAPLSRDSAITLLRCTADRTDLDDSSAARIAERCAGLPLALRVAGTRLSTLGHLRPARFADRLEQGALLDELRTGDTSVRDALDRFWWGLAEPERDALCRLSRLPAGEFTLTRAADVADPGTTPDAVERMLDGLVECNALRCAAAREPAEPRFVLDGPTQLYAAEQDARRRAAR